MRLQGTRVHGDLNRTLTHSDPKVVSSYGKICTLAVLYQYSTCNLPVHSTCTLPVHSTCTLPKYHVHSTCTLPVHSTCTLPKYPVQCTLYLYIIPEYTL